MQKESKRPAKVMKGRKRCEEVAIGVWKAEDEFATYAGSIELQAVEQSSIRMLQGSTKLLLPWVTI